MIAVKPVSFSCSEEEATTKWLCIKFFQSYFQFQRLNPWDKIEFYLAILKTRHRER